MMLTSRRLLIPGAELTQEALDATLLPQPPLRGTVIPLRVAPALLLAMVLLAAALAACGGNSSDADRERATARPRTDTGDAEPTRPGDLRQDRQRGHRRAGGHPPGNLRQDRQRVHRRAGGHPPGSLRQDRQRAHRLRPAKARPQRHGAPGANLARN